MFIKLFCPAKLNLFLEVLDKRDDGYHELDTVMMSVDLCDTVSVRVEGNNTESNRISLVCDKEGVPSDLRNIAYKAADAFLQYFSLKGYDVELEIEKKIPVAAGLAGGSADCAGVLLGLENLFSLQSRRDELLKLGARLGADVPFCMTCGCAHATGIGEIMTKLPSITPEWTFVVAKGGEGISTALAYSQIDSRESERKNSFEIRRAISRADMFSVCSNLYNAFEEVVMPEREMVGRAKRVLEENGCMGCLMSGSGPSVFGIFSSTDDAERSRDILEEMGYDSFVCYPVM